MLMHQDPSDASLMKSLIYRKEGSGEISSENWISRIPNDLTGTKRGASQTWRTDRFRCCIHDPSLTSWIRHEEGLHRVDAQRSWAWMCSFSQRSIYQGFWCIIHIFWAVIAFGKDVSGNVSMTPWAKFNFRARNRGTAFGVQNTCNNAKMQFKIVYIRSSTAVTNQGTVVTRAFTAMLERMLVTKGQNFNFLQKMWQPFLQTWFFTSNISNGVRELVRKLYKICLIHSSGDLTLLGHQVLKIDWSSSFFIKFRVVSQPHTNCYS